MNEFEVLKKVKDAVVFETAWLYESLQVSEKKKDDMLELVKVIWNRSFPRAGFDQYFNELSIDENDIRKAGEMLSHKNREYIADDAEGRG